MRFRRTTTLVDHYGIITMQIVASRSEALISLLRNLATVECGLEKRKLLEHALELA